MIALVTGKLGGGKTLYCVGEILRHLAKGGLVCTNVDIVWPELCALAKKRHRVILQDTQLRELDLKNDESWHEHVPWSKKGVRAAVLVVLDEIHLWFNSRDWATTHKRHRLMQDFLTQSRKAGVEIRFICQSSSNLDKQFRDQCEYEYFTRHVADIAVPFFGRLPFDRFLWVKRDAALQGTPKALETKIVKPDKALFVCYNSFAMLSQSMIDLGEKVERVEFVSLERVSLFAAFPFAKAIGYSLGLVSAVLTIRHLTF